MRVDAGGDVAEAGPGTLLTFEPGEQHSVASAGGARIVLILSSWPGEGHFPANRCTDNRHEGQDDDRGSRARTHRPAHTARRPRCRSRRPRSCRCKGSRSSARSSSSSSSRSPGTGSGRSGLACRRRCALDGDRPLRRFRHRPDHRAHVDPGTRRVLRPVHAGDAPAHADARDDDAGSGLAARPPSRLSRHRATRTTPGSSPRTSSSE